MIEWRTLIVRSLFILVLSTGFLMIWRREMFASIHHTVENPHQSNWWYNSFGGSTAQRTSALHLIIPTTNSNKHLCRLLLSLTALNWPSPTLIVSDEPEQDNPLVEHVTKVEGIFNHLSLSFQKSEDEDLVLIVDPYDVYFQLPPSIFISRYHEIIDSANARLEARLGRKNMTENNVYQSIIFGAGKACTPDDIRAPHCWAVPKSTLPRWAFGPDTDSGVWRHHNLPRWLNSGTIMGPVKDVRKLMEKTLNMTKTQNQGDWEQVHLSHLFAEQEYARTVLAEGPLVNRSRSVWISKGFYGEGHHKTVELSVPDLSATSETEYHITLDYESSLFQLNAYYYEYLGWRTYSDIRTKLNSRTTSGTKAKSSSSFPELQLDLRDTPTPPPLIPPDSEIHMNVTSNTIPDFPHNWSTMPLGTNIISKNVFGLIHFTDGKDLRDIWWQKMWYAPFADSIIQSIATTTRSGHRIGFTTQRCSADPIVRWPTTGGTQWLKSTKASQAAIDTGMSCIGGARLDRGKFVSWQTMCGAYEATLGQNSSESTQKGRIFLNN